MPVKVSYEGGARFVVEARGHQITVDQPLDNGGADSGPTPPELFAGSLASCIAFYVVRYCQQRDIECADLSVDCHWKVSGQPKTINHLTVEVTLPGLPESRRQALQRVAESCLIHHTLQQSSAVEVVLKDGSVQS